jgi:hypothetical protein
VTAVTARAAQRGVHQRWRPSRPASGWCRTLTEADRPRRSRPPRRHRRSPPPTCAPLRTITISVWSQQRREPSRATNPQRTPRRLVCRALRLGRRAGPTGRLRRTRVLSKSELCASARRVVPRASHAEGHRSRGRTARPGAWIQSAARPILTRRNSGRSPEASPTPRPIPTMQTPGPSQKAN